MHSIAGALLVALFMSVPAFAQSDRLNQSVRTPVIITGFENRGEMAFVEGSIRGASTASRLVLFLRLANERGLTVAADASGTPQLPRLLDTLPLPSYEGRNTTESKWQARFSRPVSQKVQEIFVVACEVKQRSSSTPESDYRSFQYLPFRQVNDIDEALTLLRDYSWSPTGYTRIALGPMGSLEPGISYNQGDLYDRPSPTAQQCASLCYNDNRCIAMTFIPSQQRCWIKGSIGPIGRSNDMVSARRIGQ